jgi:hypothetical protein
MNKAMLLCAALLVAAGLIVIQGSGLGQESLPSTTGSVKIPDGSENGTPQAGQKGWIKLEWGPQIPGSSNKRERRVAVKAAMKGDNPDGIQIVITRLAYKTDDGVHYEDTSSSEASMGGASQCCHSNGSRSKGEQD